MKGGDYSSSTWVAGILAVNDLGLGGVIIDSGVEDSFRLASAASYSKKSGPRSVPASVTVEALQGSIDLAATLATGRRVFTPGLLGEEKVLLIRRAGGIDPTCAAILAEAIDNGALALVASMDFADLDSPLAQKLADRLAFQVSDEAEPVWTEHQVAAARSRLAAIQVPDSIVEDLVRTALAFGISSPRVVTQAVSAVRAVASLSGTEVMPEQTALAAQLVFAHRATRLPPDEQIEEIPEPPQPESSPSQERESTARGPDSAERLVEAVKASLPPELLQGLSKKSHGKGASRAMRAAQKAGGKRGRRIGHKRVASLARLRLDILATLRSAAPWQAMRRKLSGLDRMIVTRDDFRALRIKQRNAATAIFVVDASGSTAFQRLAEAKGAVESVLAECYVRRDKAALISFRSKNAEILLPPTRSLERARRALAGLPGGGGTPLALAIDQAFAMALQVQRSGGAPIVIFLTDGRANVTRNGEGNKAKAMEETLAAARAFAEEALNGMVIDVSPEPQKQARALAEAMQAKYLPMPRAGSSEIARPVRQALQELGA